MSEFWLKMLAQSLVDRPPVEGDDLGGPPVLSPLEERVAALEEAIRELGWGRTFACPHCGAVRVRPGRLGSKCPACGR
jgi:hypothetical protein